MCTHNCRPCLFFSQSFQSRWRPEGKSIFAWNTALTSVWTLWCFGMVHYWTTVILIGCETSFSLASASVLCHFVFKFIWFTWVTCQALTEFMHCALAKHHWVAKWLVCWMECSEYCFWIAVCFLMPCTIPDSRVTLMHLVSLSNHSRATCPTDYSLSGTMVSWTALCCTLSVKQRERKAFTKSMFHFSRCSFEVHT